MSVVYATIMILVTIIGVLFFIVGVYLQFVNIGAGAASITEAIVVIVVVAAPIAAVVLPILWFLLSTAPVALADAVVLVG